MYVLEMYFGMKLQNSSKREELVSSISEVYSL